MRRLTLLEKQAEVVSDNASIPPLIFELPPEQGREVLNKLQSTSVYKYPAAISSIRFTSKSWGSFVVHCVIPSTSIGIENIIFYIHGAGWVFGSLHTHDKLVRELAYRTNSIVIFPEYSLSPEAKYPLAIEQCYEALCHVEDILQTIGCTRKMKTLTVAGDSVGGNMATVMTLLSKYRQGPCIHKQLLYYPVTNAYFNTESYSLYATDYYLYREGMMWFWDQYTNNDRERSEIFASPLLASIEQLQGLPPAMIVVGEADVLRSEGEAYIDKLRMAGVDVTSARFHAIIHDFVMLNALDQTNACRLAMDATVEWINRRNKESN